MISRLFYKKYIVLSALLTLLLFLLVSNSNRGSSVDSYYNASKAPFSGSSSGDGGSKQDTGRGLLGSSVITTNEDKEAGAETNNRLWQALADSQKASDSFKDRIYDYLFTSNGNTVSGSQQADSIKSFHAGKTDSSLKFNFFLYELFGKVFDLRPDTPDLEAFYQRSQDGGLIKAPTAGSNDDDPNEQKYTIDFLKRFIDLGSDKVTDLKSKHTKFVDYVKKLSLPVDFYEKNSNGIVYVGGGKYTWFALLSIKNVRKVGSNLPIELFIPSKDEYEYAVCEEILPKLNAKCVLMYEKLKDPQGVTKPIFDKASFKGFTYKSLALLLSSFENILLLDADNVPFRNPDILFANEPYASDKFVLWPDYWQRTTSPYFYDIASIDLVGLNKDEHSLGDITSTIPLHKLKGSIPNPSTESGQLMISKSKHWDVLLLSLYYNVYGPKHYYHLLSQGAAGQGDKETFLAAATVLGSTFYQVTSGVRAIGYFKSPGSDYRGTAQGQKSAIDDYNLKLVKERLEKFYREDKNNKEEIQNDDKGNENAKLIKKFLSKKLNDDDFKELAKYNNIKEPEIFFIHESTPKLDPIKLVHDGDFINDEVTDPETKENKRIRFYNNYITYKENYKFEKYQMDYIYEYLCERNLVIRFIESQINDLYVNKGKEFDKDAFCKKIDDQRKWLDSLELE